VSPKLVGRVVERVGDPIEQPCGALTSLFPTPAALADADLNGLGLSKMRVDTLKKIAAAVVGGELDFAASTDCVRAALFKLGIGSSITEIVALRALGEPDAFPATNYDLRHIAGNPIRSLSAFELEARAEAWRPWRGYAAFHLWTATTNLPEHNSNTELRQPTV
jgi:3-methyladenine DNA glycosylase/8-oxoguanine DNA glycosylase